LKVVGTIRPAAFDWNLVVLRELKIASPASRATAAILGDDSIPLIQRVAASVARKPSAATVLVKDP
jgi:hypothetical protein